MNASLVLVTSDRTQKDIAVAKTRVIIGRNTDCQIRIPIASVSRHHCELTVEDGKLFIKDLGSSNGTFVNRRRVNQTQLAGGDLVAVGSCVFVVRIDGVPAEVDPEASYRKGSLPDMAAANAPATDELTTQVMRRPPVAPVARPAAAGAPKKKSDDDDDVGELDLSGLEDSSVVDFDFSDDDDPSQPKL